MARYTGTAENSPFPGGPPSVYFVLQVLLQADQPHLTDACYLEACSLEFIEKRESCRCRAMLTFHWWISGGKKDCKQLHVIRLSTTGLHLRDCRNSDQVR